MFSSSMILLFEVPLANKLFKWRAIVALKKCILLLQRLEMQTESTLDASYRLLVTRYELIRAQRARREAFADQLDAQFRIYQAGRGTLDILLEAQRNWSQALSDE